MNRARCKAESGQLTVLILAFAICLLLVIAAVTDISASYLRRQSLASLADGAALSATDGAAAAAVYGDPRASHVALDESAARSAVDAYLQEVDAYGRFPGLRAHVEVADDVLEVRLQHDYQLPFPVPGAKSQTTIEATGSATMPIY